ncbi:GGDEF domain-containing response regulator [Imhoffiella purpurea]|uniref:diguanylate cyclase n=1 Tax=Imhoffiella purpurea TaxID=1249627 RepID=W9VL19_9GAMM|nr:diguanylate cyclase [Imhoffiella purpurea]EXJ16787.1 Two component response regulator [Imhoffiella purpurea]
MIPEPTEVSTILVVDDTAGNLDLLGRILGDAGYRVRRQPSGNLAITSALASPPDLILLDIKMPDLDGFEVCLRLKQNPSTRELPIIFISALQDASDKVRAFLSGGVDYITKPFQTEEVLARVATHLRLHALQRRLEMQNRELERLATTDPLTGILNRRSFSTYCQHYRARASRYGASFCLLILDIDRFKRINDAFGHEIGDRVLVALTERIRDTLREVDLFARWGGEEFIILSPDTPPERAGHLAERLRKSIEAATIDPIGTVTASFGLAVNRVGEELEDLIRRADHALLAAKEAGRNQVRIAE